MQYPTNVPSIIRSIEGEAYGRLQKESCTEGNLLRDEEGYKLDTTLLTCDALDLAELSPRTQAACKKFRFCLDEMRALKELLPVCERSCNQRTVARTDTTTPPSQSSSNENFQFYSVAPFADVPPHCAICSHQNYHIIEDGQGDEAM